jgi:hypothetical protein
VLSGSLIPWKTSGVATDGLLGRNPMKDETLEVGLIFEKAVSSPSTLSSIDGVACSSGWGSALRFGVLRANTGRSQSAMV